MEISGKFLDAEAGRHGTNELKAQAFASRNARKQLLQVPWRRFLGAYNGYPEWLALSFWVRAVVEVRGSRATPEVVNTLRRRCPEFLNSQSGSLDPDLLGFQLLEWAHKNVFRNASRHGWLEALTFFGPRHIHSRAAWSLWEQCEEDRRTLPPGVFQSFENWRRHSLESVICGERTYSKMAAAVEGYLRFESVARWVSPFLISGSEMTELTVRELDRQVRRCHRQSPLIAAGLGAGGSAYWRAIIRSAKRSLLRDALPAVCISDFRNFVSHHPWNVRLNAYRRVCVGRKVYRQGRRYPSFRQWLLSAERFVIGSDS